MNSIEATAVLLGAIYPSLTTGVTYDLSTSSVNLAQAVHRGHRIAQPSGSELSSPRKPDDAQRLHHEYMKATSVNGVQIVDLCHRAEYDETVLGCVADVEVVDAKISAAIAARLTQPAASSASRIVDRFPFSALSSVRTETHPAPVWLKPSRSVISNRVPVCRRRQINEACRKREVAPLRSFGDVFQHGDHKCSVAKECERIGSDVLQRRWCDAAPHIVRGLTSVLESAVLVDAEKGLPVELPWYGKGALDHEELRVAVLRSDPRKVSLRLEDSAKEQQASSSSPSTATPQQHRIAFKVKDVSIATKPQRLTFTSTSSDPNVVPKPVHETVRVKVKGISIKLVGDVLLSPTGRHVVVIDAAKVRISTVKVKTKSSLKNALLFLTRPLLTNAVEKQLEKLLKGKHQL